MFTATYIHRRPSLTVPFFADTKPRLTAKLAAKARQANGFVSQTSFMSADKLTNTVTVVWRDKGACDQFNRRGAPAHYRALREAYDAAYGTTTEISA